MQGRKFQFLNLCYDKQPYHHSHLQCFELIVYKFIACVPCNVATHQLAVHANVFATHIKFNHLTLGDGLHAFLKQVNIVFSVVVNYVATKAIIRRWCRYGIIKG